MPDAARLTISRADVADFLLDEVEHPAHLRRIVGLASVKVAMRRAS
jgi:putative NADH-flavin reductase